MTRDRPHILFFTKVDLTGQTGACIITRNIAAAFADRDSVTTTIVAPRPDGAFPEDVSEPAEAVVYLRKQSSDLSMVDRLLGAQNAVRSLRRTVRNEQPDLVVARMGPDVVAPALISRRYDVPYAMLARGTAYKRLRWSSILTRIHRFNVRTAAQVYAASNEIRDDANRMRENDQEPAELLSNAVDPEIFRPGDMVDAREAVGIDREADLVVGFAGTMRPYHRLDVLLRAKKRVDSCDVKLLLAGEGPELERLRSMAGDLGIEDAVHFPGFVPHDDLPTYLAACDVLYAVREHTSATPVKIFEYLACERPVIIRAMEELDFVQENDLGRTVPEPDPDAVADVIDQFYADGSKVRTSMGEWGRAYVKERHTWDAFAQRVLEGSLE